MSMRSLDTLPPTEILDIENGLSLVPRVKLNLTIEPSSPSSATKPIDEWKLKRALIDFLKTSLSSPVTVAEDDLEIRRCKDLKKRKRDDPLASGVLCIRDLGFISKKNGKESGEENVKVLEKKLLDWRGYIMEKMDGIELNLEGVKFKLSVAVPVSDDFERMKKDWEGFFVFGNKAYSRRMKREPDTIILRGLPSRWFAEPRVSSKPSMLVSHTIFSTFGRIRNISVAEDDIGKDTNGDGGDLVSGLHCKIVVQFEKYPDFYNAMKVLCGRSLLKEGSRLRADYEVTWDKGDFFRNSRSNTQEKTNRTPVVAIDLYRNDGPRRQPDYRYSPDNVHPKRFKE